MPSENGLPHWDLSNIFPGLESKAFTDAVQDLKKKLDDLDVYMEKHRISGENDSPDTPASLSESLIGYLDRVNEVLMQLATLRAYVGGFVSTDAYNTTAKRIESEVELLQVRLERQEILFKSWLRVVGKEKELLNEVLQLEGETSDHAFYILETVEQSRFLMSAAEETLAIELSLSAGNAWQKLQGVVTSQLKAPFERDGEVEELPMPILMNIRQYDPDETVRKRAFEAEIPAWESVRETLAACLNGVKGNVNTLDYRRGREDALHASIDQARIDRETLEAMLTAMKGSFPTFRRYWKAKAKHIGKESLAWWDLFAPIGESNRQFTYDEARGFILEQFGTFSEGMKAFTEKAFEGNWIDAEPRDGKRGGAFCMSVPGVEESRILCNFDGSLDQLSTIAHELGHAYHNEQHTGLKMLRRRTPMTLAETASIFCETIIMDAAFDQTTDHAEQLSILETQLIGDSQIIVDIYSRYLFETEVFERRRDAELSADDFCEIMLRCQEQTYSEALDERYGHSYMWAWKPHYYSPSRSFYNYPYAFGLLFGLGLYAIYKDKGSEFVEAYNGLLRSTGMGKAAELADRFGISLQEPAFWEGSLSVIGERIERYESL